jgi:hypothetical protein
MASSTSTETDSASPTHYVNNPIPPTHNENNSIPFTQNVINPIPPTHNENNPNPSPTSLSSFAQSISKLTQNNYLVWHHQLQTFLQGHDLYGFVDGTNKPPHPHTSTTIDGSLHISNDPETLRWFRQDQLILSMLMSTISEELLPQVLGCCTAQEIWTALSRTFSSTSRARTMTLHYEIATAKKGNSSITAYFQKLKHTAATLATAGHPLSDYEFTTSLLARLGPEYDPLVTSVTTRIEPLTMDDLLGHLLAHETRLEKHHGNDDFLVAANIASRGRNSYRGRGRHLGSMRTHSSNGQHRSANHSFGQYRTRGRGNTTSPFHNPSSSHGPTSILGPRPTCQICGKLGHNAMACYHRFDQAYQTTGPKIVLANCTSRS